MKTTVSKSKCFYLLYAILSIILALYQYSLIDIYTCEFDGCRYLRNNTYSDLRLIYDSYYLTSLNMHLIYGFFDPLISIVLVYSVLFLIVTKFCGLTVALLWTPILFSPGKEAFIFASILVYMSSKRVVFNQIVAFFLCTFARIEYIIIILVLDILGKSKRFFFLFFIALILSIFYNSPAVENDFSSSSFNAINVIREISLNNTFLRVPLNSFLYMLWLALLPVFELSRALNSFMNPTDLNTSSIGFLLTGITLWIYLFKSISKDKVKHLVLSAFLLASIFPIVHTRYFLPILLIITLKDARSNSGLKY